MLKIEKIKSDYVLLAVVGLFVGLVVIDGTGTTNVTSSIMVFAFLCVFRLLSGIDTIGAAGTWYGKHKSRVWPLAIALIAFMLFTVYRVFNGGISLSLAATSIVFSASFFIACVSIYTWLVERFES